MTKSIVALAKALANQHGFDYDIAYLSAWYGSGREDMPTATPYQILAWWEQVKYIPIVTEVEAKRMLQAYTKVKKGEV